MKRYVDSESIGLMRMALGAGLLVAVLLGGGCHSLSQQQARVERLSLQPDNFEEYRQHLVDLANDGNIYAASKMCDMGLWWSMREVNPENLSQWSDDPRKIGRRTARQVYAMVYANNGYRTRPSVEHKEVYRQAEQIIIKDPLDDYVVFAEWLWFARAMNPRGDYSSECVELQGLFENQQPDSEKKLEMAYWHLRPLHEKEIALAMESSVALEKIRKSIQIYRDYGCKEGLVSGLLFEADYSGPIINPQGDWQQTIKLQEKALSLFVDLEDRKGEANTLVSMAGGTRPDYNPEGNWSRAIELYQRATLIYADLGETMLRGDALLYMGDCFFPTENPDGNWDMAMELFIEAEEIFSAVDGFEWLHGISLYRQAWCMRPDNNPEGNWARAIELYIQAYEQFRHEDDDEWMEECRSMASECFMWGMFDPLHGG